MLPGRPLPGHVQEEFEAYLKCGRLEEEFLRVHCAECHSEKLVALSCKRRGFCTACSARRMAEAARIDAIVRERSVSDAALSVGHSAHRTAARPHEFAASPRKLLSRMARPERWLAA